MGWQTYTKDELEALRESPLVKKPDGLPSISQWMEVPPDQSNTTNNTANGTARRARGLRDGETGTSGDQRPLINPMGQFGRRQSMQPGEETVLGPPKLSFLSARKNAGDAKERTGITSTDGDNLGDRFPREKNERWTRDRDADRTRERGNVNGRRGTREDGEGWTSVKGRKSLGQEDFERFSGRNGDRNRDKIEGDPEAEAAPRRSNRDRPEQRWGRREDNKDEGAKTGVTGGWRDRDRERERERDWTRGGTKAEEDPEWMDTKIEKKEFKPRTQEDFQRWKEQMRAKDTPTEDKDDHRETPTSTATGVAAAPMLTQPLHTPSGAEPTQGVLFGNWGRDKAADMTASETINAKPKTDKKSRFMTMFAKPEEQSAPQAAPPAAPQMPPGFEGNADKEGFQRILQMLGQVTVGGPQESQTSILPPLNGMRQGGGVSLDLHQQSPSQAPPPSQPPRTIEQQTLLENILAPRSALNDSRQPHQPRFNSMSPENAQQEQFRLPRPDSNQPEQQFQHQAPRQHNPIDANLASVLNTHSQQESQRDQATKQRERDFLLTLMQSRATPPQAQGHGLPRPNQDMQNAPFFDQTRQMPQGHPKGRPGPGPPPGFLDEHRMFNENDMMRREAEARREQELRQQLNMHQQQEAMRIKNTRIPMGYQGHEDPTMGLPRRSTADNSRPTNMGIPSQPVPDMSFLGGRGQPGMPHTPQERPNVAPPPGFGGPMRQPPGLGGPGPNPQQGMGPGGPSFSAGNTPLGHPPGFPPPGNMRGMGFPGGPGGPVGPGGNGMQGPPQGYFPPPGYGPPMPGMRGEDPRMMFDGGHQGFGGPGGPRQQQGRPGPPGMY